MLLPDVMRHLPQDKRGVKHIMKSIVFRFCILASLTLFQNLLFAQDSSSEPTHNYAWIDLGLGTVSSSSFSGFGGTLTASHLSRLGLITLRFVGAGDESLQPANLNAADLHTISEIGALYGRTIKSDFLFASASAGIGVVWTSYHRSTTSEYTMTSVGLPLQLEVFFVPMPVIALGTKLLIDVNNNSAFTGVLFCLRAGLLRYVRNDQGK